jgi:hypothetical protein
MLKLDMAWHALTIRDQAIISAAAPCGLGIHWIVLTSEEKLRPSFKFNRGQRRLFIELPCRRLDLSASPRWDGLDAFMDDCHMVLPGDVNRGLATIAQKLSTERPDLLRKVLY